MNFYEFFKSISFLIQPLSYFHYFGSDFCLLRQHCTHKSRCVDLIIASHNQSEDWTGYKQANTLSRLSAPNFLDIKLKICTPEMPAQKKRLCAQLHQVA